jgi:ferric-dicitrate binding protein FerR (iron transport regulator)
VERTAALMRPSKMKCAVLALFLSKLVCGQLPIDTLVMKQFEARAVEVTGEVSRARGELPWVVAQGEHVPVGQIIKTGRDGYARFTVDGGSEFSLLSNSFVAFRSNTARAGDLLDVVSGRVRVKLQPMPGQLQQRVFTALAIISATHPALISIAIDEDQNVRLDVLEGEVRVQHRLLPRNEPTLVRAVDVILIEPNQQLSRRMDRGTLFRYTVKPLHDLWVAVTPSWAHSGEPVEGNKFLQADLRTSF